MPVPRAVDSDRRAHGPGGRRQQDLNQRAHQSCHPDSDADVAIVVTTNSNSDSDFTIGAPLDGSAARRARAARPRKQAVSPDNLTLWVAPAQPWAECRGSRA